MPADDVDHAIYRIDAPHGCARTPDNFDAFDVFKRDGIVFPDGSGKEWMIDGAPVYQYLKLVGEAAVEAACRNGVAPAVDLCNLDTRNHA